MAVDRHFFSPGTCGFLLCLEGGLSVTMLGTEYRLAPLDMIVFHPFVKAGFSEISDDMRGYMGEVDMGNVLPVVNQVVNSENLVRMRKCPVVPLTRAQTALLLLHIHRHAASQAEANTSSQTELILLNQAMSGNCGDIVLLEVLRLYFKNRPAGEVNLSPRDIIFQRFMLDVQRYCTVRRDTMFYASRSGLSPKYFSAVIREHSGAPPSEWIIQNVIAEAKRLLRDLSLSIKEIAEALHFPSQAQFTKYFRRYADQPPTRYRHK